MTDDTLDRDPIDLLAESFMALHRNGSGPSIEEFAGEHPEYASDIRDLFPMIIDIERVKERLDDTAGGPATLGPRRIEQLGDFRVIREIGRGGMGIVYEAEQQSLHRRVAIKVLGKKAAGSSRQLERFHREAESAARLHHSNIVPVYGIGESDDLHFYAMQFIDGVGLDLVLDELRRRDDADHCAEETVVDAASTLATARPSPASAAARALCDGSYSSASKSGPSARNPSARAPSVKQPGNSTSATQVASPPETRGQAATTGRLGSDYWKSVARIGADVADGMAHAHDHGILHRDIKPANLLIDREGHVWITDFGLAKHEEHGSLTLTGDMVGTLRYMAAEQFRGESDVRTDVYGLGLTLYEMLALTPAFSETNQAKLIQQKTASTVPTLRVKNPQIPADLETIVLKACATDASHRYRSAAALAEDLHRFLDDRPILARPTTYVERLWRWSRRNPAIAGLSAATALLLVFAVGALAVGNYRTAKALASVDEERENAVAAADDAERERRRAQTNLKLALAAFEDVINNVANRGVPASLEISATEGDAAEPAPRDSIVTSADAELLKTLLAFFNHFATQNQTDLQAETALAHRSIGDIQYRLGKLALAESAYREAIAVYGSLIDGTTGDASPYYLARAETMNDLAVAVSRTGDMRRAFDSHQMVLRLFDAAPALAQSMKGKYELARTLNLLGSTFSRVGADQMEQTLMESRANRGGRGRYPGSNPENRGGPPGFGMNRRGGPGGHPREHRRSPRDLMRLIEQDSHTAMSLLSELASEDPANVKYRLAMAETHLNQVRNSQRFDRDGATDAHETAVAFLEDAGQDFPTEPAFQYALAELLGMPLNQADAEAGAIERLEKAASICRRLVHTYPNIPEYQEQCGRILSNQAVAYRRAGEWEQSEAKFLEALRQLENLASRLASVSTYRFTYCQTLFRLAELYRQQNKQEMARERLETIIARLKPLEGEQASRNHLYLFFLGNVYETLGDTLRQMGDHDQAREMRRRAEQVKRTAMARRGGRGGGGRVGPGRGPGRNGR